jgi:hypothetical protein
MTAVKEALDDLIRDLEALLDQQPDQQKIFDAGLPAWSG